MAYNNRNNTVPFIITARKIVAKWKLECAIATLQAKTTSIPEAALAIYNDVVAGKEVSQDQLVEAFVECCDLEKGLRKQLDRLAYLQLELVVLIHNLKLDGRNPKVGAAQETLKYMPVDGHDYISAEIKLRKSIHGLLGDELKVANENIYSETLNISKAQVSNHVYNLVTFARMMPEKVNRMGVEALLKNQMTLIARLIDDTKKRLSPILEKKILKAAHWQPKALDEAERIYQDTLECLGIIESEDTIAG